MKDLKAIRGRNYVLDLIAHGEHERQDFKYVISDARKIARSISAFANRSGGWLLVGVKDNGVIAGVRNEEDIYVIEQAAQLYCSPAQEVAFTAYSTGETGIVIKAEVQPAAQRPVMAQENDKSWRAYYRVADENIAAHALMVKAWRMRENCSSNLYRTGGFAATLINALEEKGSLDIGAALRLGAVSRRTAEDTIARLAAMGLIDFKYIDGGFRLIRP